MSTFLPYFSPWMTSGAIQFGVPMPVCLALVVAVLPWIVLTWTAVPKSASLILVNASRRTLDPTTKESFVVLLFKMIIQWSLLHRQTVHKDHLSIRPSFYN